MPSYLQVPLAVSTLYHDGSDVTSKFLRRGEPLSGLQETFFHRGHAGETIVRVLIFRDHIIRPGEPGVPTQYRYKQRTGNWVRLVAHVGYERVEIPIDIHLKVRGKNSTCCCTHATATCFYALDVLCSWPQEGGACGRQTQARYAGRPLAGNA
jgi:hypothetical protein